MATTAERLADAAHEAGEHADEALRRKAAQLQKFFDDVEELLRRAPESGDAEIGALRRRVQASLGHAREAARQGARAAWETTRSAGRATDGYVHANPWRAIGVTAVAGVLVGALLGRK